MDKSQNIRPTGDIAREEYKGPNAFVVAMGQGVFEHLKWALFGLGGLGIVALLLPEQAKAFNAASRQFAQKLKLCGLPEDAGFFPLLVHRFKKGCGGLLHAIVGEGKGAVTVQSVDPKHDQWLSYVILDKERGFGQWFLSHTAGLIPFVGKEIKKLLAGASDKCANALTVGGVAGLIGYAGGWIKAIVTGGAHAHSARNQFDRIQQEVIDQRAVTEALSEKYIDTKQQLEDLKTTQAAEKGTLQVAPDNPPPMHGHTKPNDIVPPPDAITVREPIATKHGKGKSDWKDTIAEQRAHAPEHHELA
jgi:hypothetical protein